MISINVLKIYFSLFFLLICGCFSTHSSCTWPIPVKPETKSVEIVLIKDAKIQDDGYYINRESAYNLANNVDSLKAYIEKMEFLIKEMVKYYGDKTEEYR